MDLDRESEENRYLEDLLPKDTKMLMNGIPISSDRIYAAQTVAENGCYMANLVLNENDELECIDYSYVRLSDAEADK